VTVTTTRSSSTVTSTFASVAAACLATFVSASATVK
jgi:hypothetical protein